MKRVALAAMVVFLDLNGYELTCGETEETAMILKATAGEIKEATWSAWVEWRARKKRYGRPFPLREILDNPPTKVILIERQV